MSGKEIKSNWQIIKDNQIAYFDESYVAEKKIESAGIFYLVDTNRHVHICSLTPSIELWPMFAFVTFTDDPPDTGEVASEIEQEILASENPCEYVNASDFSRYPSRPLSDYFTMPDRDEEDYPDTEQGDEDYYKHCIESAREYLNGNQCWF